MKLLILFLFFSFVTSQTITCSTYSNAGCKGDSEDISFDLGVCTFDRFSSYTYRNYSQEGEDFFVRTYTDPSCSSFTQVGSKTFIGTTSCTYYPKWIQCSTYSTASRINSGSVFLLLSMIALFFGLNQ
eukprot:TRINITY_DN2181_c0_g3_i2.p1 TRINITY_DN2181_c0_g3~~TRINITY_DN2181_c0_g3_i2.p1  ORF type:complete len:128 (+),score=19.40 TRINITY_DN2181_c0_g3_i2:66-449(+)